MLPLNLYARVRVFKCAIAHETAGAARTRSSLRPPFVARVKRNANLGCQAPQFGHFREEIQVRRAGETVRSDGHTHTRREEVRGLLDAKAVNRVLGDVFGDGDAVDAIRIEELVNYFSYSLEEPRGKDPIAITTEVAPAPWQSKHQLVRIALQIGVVAAYFRPRRQPECDPGDDGAPGQFMLEDAVTIAGAAVGGAQTEPAAVDRVPCHDMVEAIDQFDAVGADVLYRCCADGAGDQREVLESVPAMRQRAGDPVVPGFAGGDGDGHAVSGAVQYFDAARAHVQHRTREVGAEHDVAAAAQHQQRFAAALLGRELTLPDVAQSVILTRTAVRASAMKRFFSGPIFCTAPSPKRLTAEAVRPGTSNSRTRPSIATVTDSVSSARQRW